MLQKLLPPLAFALSLGALAGCQSSSGTKVDPVRQLELHAQLARDYYEMGELDRAQDQASKGLDIDPDHVQLRMLLGWTLQRRGGTEDILVAERVFRDVLSEGDYRANLGLAASLERKGLLYDEAARRIQSGRQLPDRGTPEQRVVELQQETEKAWEEAERMYEASIALRPDAKEAFGGLQRLTALRGDSQASIEWSEKLIAILDAEAEAWERLRARPEINADDERRWRKLVVQNDRIAVESLLAASSTLLAAGDELAAATRLTRIIAIEPERREIYSRRAQIYAKLGREQDAIDDLAAFQHLAAIADVPFDDPDLRRTMEMKHELEESLRRKGLRPDR